MSSNEINILNSNSKSIESFYNDDKYVTLNLNSQFEEDQIDFTILDKISKSLKADNDNFAFVFHSEDEDHPSHSFLKRKVFNENAFLGSEEESRIASKFTSTSSFAVISSVERNIFWTEEQNNNVFQEYSINKLSSCDKYNKIEEYEVDTYKNKLEEEKEDDEKEIMLFITNNFNHNTNNQNSNPINKIIEFFKSKSNNLKSNENVLVNEISNKNDTKKCCSCIKSHCLKLYCDCFKKENYCFNCTCPYCLNKKKYEIVRQKSISYLKMKNKHAFKPVIIEKSDNHQNEKVNKEHIKGCKCVNSSCIKNYCECFQFGTKCTSSCKCQNCLN